MKKIVNAVIGYFLQGVIVVVPLVAVYLTGKYLYDLVDSYRVFDNAWITLAIIIGAIFLIGLATRFIVFKPLFLVFENVLSRTPLFKFVYTSIKDLMKAFVGDQRRFSKPVLVDLHAETHLQRFGFVTAEQLELLGEGFLGKVTVYIPMSYSFSGNLYVVPGDLVEPLPHVDPAELMKFILAGGVTDLEDLLKKKNDRSIAEKNDN